MAKTIILLIDNDEDLRKNIKELLVLAGYNVVVAKNGKDGLAAIHKHQPDLVLCEVSTPGLDGYGVLRAAQNIAHMIHVPFILLSNKASEKDLRKGMNLGADDYLVKPLDEDLLEVINIQLKKSIRIKQQLESKKTNYPLIDTDGFSELFSSSPFKVIKKVKPRHAIYMEGDSVSFIYFLVAGKVKTYIRNKDGKEMITGLYKDGDIFGYTSFFEEARKESCDTIEQSELIYIPRIVFLEILEFDNNVAIKLIQIVLSQLRDTGNRMMNLAYNSSSKKIAEALIQYARVYQDGQEDFPFDRRDISNIAGVAKESVSRKMSHFSNKGMIKLNPKNGNIKIDDEKKFESLD